MQTHKGDLTVRLLRDVDTEKHQGFNVELVRLDSPKPGALPDGTVPGHHLSLRTSLTTWLERLEPAP